MYNSTMLRSLILLLWATSLASCTALLSLGDKQCNQSADCVSAQLGDRCVDHACVYSDSSCGPLPEATQPMVTYGFKVVDFLTKETPANVVVNACRNSDAACAQPVATWTDTAEHGGNATFMLPAGFFGYFAITSDALPALLYVTQPITRDSENRDVPVLSTGTVQLLASLAGFDYDTGKGLALLEALDCSGAPQGGVQFKESRGTADQFYLIDQNPSPDAQLTKYDPTDNTADGGFINLDPGFITFSAYLGVDGMSIGSFNAQIRANTITFIDMHF
jgi:hypothetical protein